MERGYSILEQEGFTHCRVPSDEAGLILIDEDEESETHCRKFSFSQFLEQFVKIHLVKCFREIQEAAEDI